MMSMPSRYVQAPASYEPSPGDPPVVFIAGGITGTPPSWQKAVARALGHAECVVINPRQDEYPVGDPAAAEAQVQWETRHRRLADMMIFRFPDTRPPVTQPVALLEIGAALTRAQHDRRFALVVGASPGYCRRADVVFQCRHDGGVPVHDTVDLTVGTAHTLLRARNRGAR